MAQTHGHSVDEYLETIYFLAFPIGEYRPSTGSTAIAARVAEMLGVSRASAGEMLKRLEADGLVERGDQNARHQRKSEQQVQRDGRAQHFGKIAGRDGDFAERPQRVADGAGIGFAARLREVASRDDSQSGG